MGNCCEKENDLDKQLAEDFKEQQKLLKLLLLGAAGGGKSTLLKQMQILHSKGFESAEERLKYKANVHANLMIALDRLLLGIDKLIARFEMAETEKAKVILFEFMKNQDYVDPLECEDFIRVIKVIWADPAIHEQVLPNGHQVQMLECTEYFMNALDRITTPDYVPSVQDILMMRVPTTGIVEVKFSVNNYDFQVYDVGGQRTERRKWIHCFDNVHAIIFVVAISEFDECLEEDHNINRMLESMRLFRSICIAKWFIRTAIILFLNKKDLFEKKIRHKSVKTVFPSYSGSNSYTDQVNYIQYKFESLNPNRHKQIYSHQTCATDTNQMELVLKNVFELILLSMYKKTSMY